MSPVDAYRPPQFSADIDLDLSRNEGTPWPLSDAAFAIDLDAVSRYPETTPLRRAVASRHGVDPDRVLITAGGDDALGRCFASRAGATVVTTTPSFEMIARYSSQTGGRLVEVGWWDGDFPVAEFLDQAGSAEMAVIVSPNNPTGAVVTEAGLRKIADAFSLVVLDAAYADFADEDLTDAALGMGNVVVVRTLSKAFGLAGLRVGYLLGTAETIAEIAAFGSPYPVSGLSAHLAEAALASEPADRSDYVDGILEGRRLLTEALEELGARPLPSQGNFVLATAVDPVWLVPAAASLGLGLREFPGRPNLAGCVRITVPRDPDELDRLLATLRSVLAPEGLIFDLDGVIADVSGSYREAIIATAARFGVVVDQADVGAAKVEGGANDDWELTRRLCLAAGVDVSLAAVVEEFQRLYDGADGREGLKLRERPLLDAATLRRLAGRMPLAVVTGRPRTEAMAFLNRFGLTEAFTTIVTRDDAALKPDPAPVRLALGGLGVTHAWMVGDTIDDLDAARGAGVVPIGVIAPGDDPETASRGLRGAAVILESIGQLEEVLDAQSR